MTKWVGLTDTVERYTQKRAPARPFLFYARTIAVGYSASEKLLTLKKQAEEADDAGEKAMD